jgi:hypothetical protein
MKRDNVESNLKSKDVIKYMVKRFDNPSISFSEFINEFLFMADWRHTCNYRQPITDIEWINRGSLPQPSNLNLTINHTHKNSFQSSFLSQVFGQYSLFADTPDILDDSETATLDEILSIINTEIDSYDDVSDIVSALYPIANSSPGDILNLKKWVKRKTLWEQRHKQTLDNYGFDE